MLKRDCIIPGHLSKSDPVTSVLENEEGLYHPGTSVQNRIASYLNFGSERYWEASVLENVVGLYHP